MKITVTQYAKALLETLRDSSQSEVQDRVANFLRILRQNNQWNLSERILEKFSAIYDVENRIVSATITSTAPLDAETLKNIEQFVAKKYGAQKVNLENAIDARIRGGIILKVGNELLDASVSRRLQELKKQLVK
jgi:F-type H+-transporting ATPase subunit delta